MAGKESTGQYSDDRVHDFGADKYFESAEHARMEALRTSVKSHGYPVEDLSDDEVVTTAINEGILDRGAMVDSYHAAHPEVDPSNENPPKGLDTPTAEEAGPAALFHDYATRSVAEAYELDRNGDIVNQVEHIRAAGHHEVRDLATTVTGIDDPGVGDAELRDEVNNEAVRQYAGVPDSPLDGETIALHVNASSEAQANEIRQELINGYGYSEEQLAGRSLQELVNIQSWEERNESASDVDATSQPVAPLLSELVVATTGATEQAADDAPATEQEAAPESPEVATETTRSAPPPAADATQEAAAGAQPAQTDTSESIETEITITAGDGQLMVMAPYLDLFSTGDGANYAYQDGVWVDEYGEIWYVAGTDGMPVLVTTEEGAALLAEHESSQGNGDGQSAEGGPSSESSQSTDDDGQSTDDDGQSTDDDGQSTDDDDDDDGQSTEDETTDAPAEGEEDDESESTSAGGDAGTPRPEGDEPVDPADRERWDDSPFGEAERKAQVDAVDAAQGSAGAPDDDPSDADVIDFLTSKAGAEQLDAFGQGVEQRHDGGDRDPLDIDDVEENGDVIDIKLMGGGAIDPSEDGPQLEMGGRAPLDGVPESIAGGPPVAGPIGTIEAVTDDYADDIHFNSDLQVEFDVHADVGPDIDDLDLVD